MPILVCGICGIYKSVLFIQIATNFVNMDEMQTNLTKYSNINKIRQNVTEIFTAENNGLKITTAICLMLL